MRQGFLLFFLVWFFFQRRGATEHTFSLFLPLTLPSLSSPTASDRGYLLSVADLRKEIGATIMHSDFSLLPLGDLEELGGSGSEDLTPPVLPTFLADPLWPDSTLLTLRLCRGLQGNGKPELFTGEHSGLRSSCSPRGAKHLKISSWSL